MKSLKLSAAVAADADALMSGVAEHTPDEVRATVLRVAVQEASRLDFGKLACILQDSELVRAGVLNPRKRGADLQTFDRDLASEFAEFQSRRLLQQSMGCPVRGLLRRRPGFCELLTDMRPLVSVTMHSMWFEHTKWYVQRLNGRLYDVEPDHIYCWATPSRSFEWCGR